MFYKLLCCLMFFSCLTGMETISYSQDFDYKKNEAELKNGEIIVTKLDVKKPGILGGRSAGIIKMPAADVWSVLNDLNKFREFMPKVKESSIVDGEAVKKAAGKEKWGRSEIESFVKKNKLEKVAGDTVYYYSVFDMPFPFGDLWYMLKKIINNRDMTISWDLVVGNMIANYGSWELRTVDGDLRQSDLSQTLVIYTTYSDSGIRIPGFISNIGLKKTLPGVIKALRKRVISIHK